MAAGLTQTSYKDGSGSLQNLWVYQDGNGYNYNLVKTNAARNGGVLHRSSITTADKLTNPSSPTLAGSTITSGSLVSATTYVVVVAAAGTYGNTLNASTALIPGSTNNALRTTISSITGATAYDLFLGTSSGSGIPWVGRVSATQLAAGGSTITTVGTIGTSGSAPAGAIDIGVIGTGQIHLAQSWQYNTAYSWSGITPINCSGYSRAHVSVYLSLTDLRTAPLLVLTPVFVNQNDSNYYLGSSINVPISGSPSGGLYQVFDMDVDGSTDLLFLVDTITGQGASVNLRVELS